VTIIIRRSCRKEDIGAVRRVVTSRAARRHFKRAPCAKKHTGSRLLRDLQCCGGECHGGCLSSGGFASTELGELLRRVFKGPCVPGSEPPPYQSCRFLHGGRTANRRQRRNTTTPLRTVLLISTPVLAVKSTEGCPSC
jgi:hypothetical protein